MKKTIPILVLLACAIGAEAQNRPRYVFDNFSSGKAGVNSSIKSVLKTPVAKEKAQNENLVHKTGQQIAVNTRQLLLTVNPRTAAEKGKLSAGLNKSLRGLTTGDVEIDGFIVDSCLRHRIDPLLIYAQMNQESSFKLRATSYKGARGLMQLMPPTAVRFGVTDIYDPQQNIEGGVKYMRWLLDTFNGDLSLALAGYNAGEGAVMKYGREIPPYNETREYVRRISARYKMLRDPNGLRSENIFSPVITTSPVTTTLEVKKPGSISIAERSVYAVRTPDGKVQLVSQ